MRWKWIPLFLLAPVALLTGLALRGCLPAGEDFTVPSAARRRAAIGPLEGLTPLQLRAFTDETGFRPVPAPQPHDWLANHPEIGQTYGEWLAHDPNLPRGDRKVIYLQPLGAFDEVGTARLELLKEFMGIFFGLEVRLRKVRGLERLGITERNNPHSGKKQYLAGDFLKVLRQRLPGDAYCLLGVTMVDLYPDPDWNFVFGMAHLKHRTGIYSLARYDNRFYDEALEPTPEAAFLLRCLKVMAHETGHMFNIKHEIYWHCLLNGSNHLGETDAGPIHLCPLNLRKLHHAVGFDLVDRYSKLEGFYREHELVEQADWVEARLAVITAE